MFFSVLIPVYNTEKYLKRCLDSVCNQSFVDYEIIVVDDGSTDSSGLICDEYSRYNSKVRVFHNENHGLIYTRRFALANAKGDYIINLDSDDYIKAGALELIHEKLIQKDIDCLIFNFDRVSDNQVLYTSSMGSLNGYYKKDNVVLLELLSNDLYNSLARKVTKRCLIGVWDYSKSFDVRIGEDLLQSLEIYSAASSFYFLVDSLYNYYVNPDSMIQALNYENYRMDYSVRETIIDYINRNQLLSDKDVNTLKHHYASLLINDVIRIGYFKTSYDNRRCLIREIRESNYFKKVLHISHLNLLKYKDKAIVFYLLYMRMYNSILLLCQFNKRRNN